MSDTDYAMYIIVNSELGMSPGKVASQVGHIINQMTEELVTEMYESVTINKKCENYIIWKENPIIIVLESFYDDMLQLLLAKYDDCRTFKDSGKTTQGTKDKITVLGFLPGPKRENSERFKGCKLLA